MYSARAPRTSRHFYPRPPRGGRHPGRVSTGGQPNFYPRPPRGGRLKLVIRPLGGVGISIHALREEGDGSRRAAGFVVSISIHALREEGDADAKTAGVPVFIFLSTPSARRATAMEREKLAAPLISIHALREEGDEVHIAAPHGILYFYPRPPRGGRHFRLDCLAFDRPDFYPRPPRGGRRAARKGYARHLQISIHALREEGDAAASVMLTFSRQFLSTPSARRATCLLATLLLPALFLSTPSARRATADTVPALAAHRFLSTPSARRATNTAGHS